MRRKMRTTTTMERYLLKWQRLPKAVSKRWTISEKTMKSVQLRTMRTDCRGPHNSALYDDKHGSWDGKG